MRFSGIAKSIANCSGLDAGIFRFGIQFDNVVEIFRPVYDHGHVAALSSQTGATSSRKQRRSELPTRGNRLDDVLLGSGINHPDRHLTVVGAVGGIKRFTASIEA